MSFKTGGIQNSKSSSQTILLWQLKIVQRQEMIGRSKKILVSLNLYKTGANLRISIFWSRSSKALRIYKIRCQLAKSIGLNCQEPRVRDAVFRLAATCLKMMKISVTKGSPYTKLKCVECTKTKICLSSPMLSTKWPRKRFHKNLSRIKIFTIQF